MADNLDDDTRTPRHAELQHTCRSIKDIIITLNGVTLEGADAVMFTPPSTNRTPPEEQNGRTLNTHGAILSSDDTFNRAFDWQAAQKHTDVSHMDADISISGIFKCNAAGNSAHWTLRNAATTHVNRNVDLLEPGTDMYQFQANAEKT